MMTEQSATDLELGRRYVTRWFWPIERLAHSCGCDAATVLRLIEAGCAPGPIYSLSPDGNWWSVLAARRGQAPTQPEKDWQRWYSPGAAWGLRIALLLMRDGATPDAAAELLAERFRLRFAHALLREPLAKEGVFSACFDHTGEVVGAAVEAVARSEWRAWIGGGYAVCLKIFTADTCVAKESLAASLKRGLAADADAIEMLAQAETLSGMILPFAPWERPFGTPGLTIDLLLERCSLGAELPYS